MKMKIDACCDRYVMFIVDSLANSCQFFTEMSTIRYLLYAKFSVGHCHQ